MKLAADVDYNAVLKKLKTAFKEKQAEYKSSPKFNQDDFEKLSILGSGAFGTVRLVKHKKSEKYYAIKILLKKHIIKQKQLQHTLQEKRILSCIKFPFTVYLAFSYKDNESIYFGLPFINGGELFTHLRNSHRFDESHSKFYAAQVCLALEYLHSLDIVYRDLKPENILLDYKGYIKVTDFGFCKIVEGRTWTLCGTPEYLAPEVIQTKGYNKCIDWWSFGILIYEMNAGISPFYAATDDPMILFNKIVDGKYKNPSHFSSDLKNIIFNLLQVDITKRYGNLKNGVNDIKNHSWFINTNWISVLNKEVNAPFIPNVKNAGDTTNFDEFDDTLERIDKSKKCLYEKEFNDF